MWVKINVVESISKIDIAYEAKQMVSEDAAVMTDGKTSYRVLDSIAKKHKTVIVKDKKEVSQIFPWVHITISNVRKKILGLHHSVKDTYMQNYQNEFCYKLIGLGILSASNIKFFDLAIYFSNFVLK